MEELCLGYSLKHYKGEEEPSELQKQGREEVRYNQAINCSKFPFDLLAGGNFLGGLILHEAGNLGSKVERHHFAIALWT